MGCCGEKESKNYWDHGSSVTVQIGDTCSYQGRDYRVQGCDPHSVSPQRIYLVDLATGRQLVVSRDEFERAQAAGKSTSRRSR
jgi:hypothetical protein